MRGFDLERLLVRSARRAVGALRRTPAIRRLLYRGENESAFSALYQHDGMLADRVRVDLYARAIERHVRPGMVIAEVGTGTGVLACLAARRGAFVHAIEHSEIIVHAEQLARANGLSDRIAFHRMHSRDFRPAEKVDAILHEQIGLNLIDEDMVENLIALRARIGKPGAVILPARFALLAAPVQLRDSHAVPYHWEHRFHGLDFSCFRPEPAPWKVGHGDDKRLMDPGEVARSLAPGERLLSLDLDTQRDTSVPREVTLETTAREDGRLDGFALYFEIAFDDELSLRTGPDDPRTHWMTRLLRTEARAVRAGQRIRLRIEIENPTRAAGWTWDYSVE